MRSKLLALLLTTNYIFACGCVDAGSEKPAVEAVKTSIKVADKALSVTVKATAEMLRITGVNDTSSNQMLSNIYTLKQKNALSYAELISIFRK